MSFWYTRRIVYNEGAQTVYHVPRDERGYCRHATSPTYSIIDLRHGEGDSERTIQASTVAAVGTETETLASAAGPAQTDPTLIDVTDAGDFTAGRVYLLEENGLFEEVRIDRVDSSADRLYATADLRNAFTTAATIRAVMLQGTFPSAEAADETEVEDHGGPYAVIWSYTIDGIEYTRLEERWLSRYAIAPWIGVSDIISAWPAFSRQSRGIYRLTSAAELACEHVMADLLASGNDEYYLPSLRYTMAITRALQICHEWHGNVEMADRARDEYRRLLGAVTVGVPARKTVRIDHAAETAKSGSDDHYQFQFLRRS